GIPIERAGTQRLTAHRLTEACTRRVHQQRVILGELDLALDVRPPHFGAESERGADRPVPTGLGRDLYDTVAGASPVERRRRRSPHHLHALDVERVQVGQAAGADLRWS